MTGTYDIFISHAQSTTALTRRVADALRALGYTVWWDEEIPLHRRFSRVIDERVRGAKAVVVLWSSDALDSDWVHGEADIARHAGTLVQVSVDGTVPPLPFNQIQYAHLTDWSGDASAPGWRKLVASVGELVIGAPSQSATVAQNSSATLPSQAARRSQIIAVGGVALLVVLGAASIWWFVTQAPEQPIAQDHAPASGRTTDYAAVGSDSSFANRPAIAVLPFVNLSDDPQQAIFADGLSEDLITRLSAWRAFPVIGRVSSFHYRGDVDVKQVAQELNVRYIVQGSVRRTTDRIRITAQLVDTSSSETIWTQTYDRNVADVFDLQDEISAAIVAPLVGDLTRAEANRARRRDTRNLEAWSLYQLGEARIVQPTPKDVAEARALFAQAVALEPQFASAHAELSISYTWEVSLGVASEPGHTLTLALESARRAVALDPRDWSGHSALAFALLLSGDTANALASAERAIDLNPSSPHALSTLAYAKLMSGDAQGCVEAIERWLRLDPQWMVPAAHEDLSEAYFELGRFDLGLEHGRKALSAQPDYLWGHLDVAMNAARLGQLDDARAAIAQARRIQPNLSLAWVQQTSGATNPEMLARWSAALHEAGLD